MQTLQSYANTQQLVDGVCTCVGGWRALSRKLVLPKVVNININIIIMTIIMNIINTNIIIVIMGWSFPEVDVAQGHLACRQG